MHTIIASESIATTNVPTKPTTKKSTTCEDGWTAFGHHCYKHFCKSLNLNQAMFECQRVKSYLISIHSEEEHDFVVKLAKNCQKDHIWLGGRVIGLNPIVLFWHDDSDFEFQMLKQRRLSSWGSDSVQLHKAGNKWDVTVHTSTANYSFMCKKLRN